MIGLAWWRRLRIFPAGLLSLAMGLAGCQAVSVDEGSLGRGFCRSGGYQFNPWRWAVLVTCCCGGAGMRTKARDLADGAKLALDDLGAGSNQDRFPANRLRGRAGGNEGSGGGRVGARMIIGPATHSQLRALCPPPADHARQCLPWRRASGRRQTYLAAVPGRDRQCA